MLLNPDVETIYPRADLDAGNFANAAPMHWNTQASGIQIPDAVATVLENEWEDFLRTKELVQGSGRPLNIRAPEEILSETTYCEGAAVSVLVNRYERDKKARDKCIQHYGARCYICGFDFEKMYGPIGTGYIHVHHLKQLSTVGANYEVNTFQDLRPVCPNCHAMIHSRKEPYTIEEIKQTLHKP